MSAPFQCRAARDVLVAGRRSGVLDLEIDDPGLEQTWLRVVQVQMLCVDGKVANRCWLLRKRAMSANLGLGFGDEKASRRGENMTAEGTPTIK